MTAAAAAPAGAAANMAGPTVAEMTVASAQTSLPSTGCCARRVPPRTTAWCRTSTPAPAAEATPRSEYTTVYAAPEVMELYAAIIAEKQLWENGRQNSTVLPDALAASRALAAAQGDFRVAAVELGTGVPQIREVLKIRQPEEMSA